MTFCDYKVYAEQLAQLGIGIPMWYPEPDTPENEVRTGDVGVLVEGKFLRLFNAIEAEIRKPDEAYPPNFVPLAMDRLLRSYVPNLLDPGDHTSAEVKIIAADAHAGVYVELIHHLTRPHGFL